MISLILVSGKADMMENVTAKAKSNINDKRKFMEKKHWFLIYMHQGTESQNS